MPGVSETGIGAWACARALPAIATNATRAGANARARRLEMGFGSTRVNAPDRRNATRTPRLRPPDDSPYNPLPPNPIPRRGAAALRAEHPHRPDPKRRVDVLVVRLIADRDPAVRREPGARERRDAVDAHRRVSGPVGGEDEG